MSNVDSRARRVRIPVYFACVVAALATVSSAESAPTPRPPVLLKTDAVESAKSPSPMVVYLHGMCGGPEHGCGYFRDKVPDAAWLVCPTAPSACPGGGTQWHGPLSSRAAVLADAEKRLLSEHPGQVDAARGRVLIGFSQGAYLARDLLRAEPGRYRGVLFIGADIQLAAETLRAAGVKRAAFASGQFDMMRRPLERAAASLTAEKFPARFVDLGRVGHTYVPAADDSVLRETLSWLDAVE
jgi:predicted esterase